MEGPFGCFHLSAIAHNDALHGASQEALAVKNPPASAGDLRDTCSTPGSGKTPWRRARQPTPLFLPGESHGQGSLAGYSPWGCTEKRLSTYARCSEHESIIICSSPCLQSFGICTQKWNHWIRRWFYAWFFERLPSCRGHTILHSHQSWRIWVAISPHPQQHLLFSDFLFIIAIPIRHRFLSHITPVHS